MRRSINRSSNGAFRRFDRFQRSVAMRSFLLAPCIASIACRTMPSSRLAIDARSARSIFTSPVPWSVLWLFQSGRFRELLPRRHVSESLSEQRAASSYSVHRELCDRWRFACNERASHTTLISMSACEGKRTAASVPSGFVVYGNPGGSAELEIVCIEVTVPRSGAALAVDPAGSGAPLPVAAIRAARPSTCEARFFTPTQGNSRKRAFRTTSLCLRYFPRPADPLVAAGHLGTAKSKSRQPSLRPCRPALAQVRPLREGEPVYDDRKRRDVRRLAGSRRAARARCAAAGGVATDGAAARSRDARGTACRRGPVARRTGTAFGAGSRVLSSVPCRVLAARAGLAASSEQSAPRNGGERSATTGAANANRVRYCGRGWRVGTPPGMRGGQGSRPCASGEAAHGRHREPPRHGSGAEQRQPGAKRPARRFQRAGRLQVSRHSLFSHRAAPFGVDGGFHRGRLFPLS